MASVETNVTSVINNLTLLQRRHIPSAAKAAVKRAGFQLAKRRFPDYMRKNFANPVPLTTNKIFYNYSENKSAGEYSVSIGFIKQVPKGNAPASYLLSTIPGNPRGAYATKFTRFLHKSGIAPRNYWPIAMAGNEGVPTNRYGNARQSVYANARTGLISSNMKGSRAYRYFSIPDGRRRGPASRQGSLFDLKEGIYRVKGRSYRFNPSRQSGGFSLNMIFAYAKSRPQAKTQKFDWELIARTYIKQELNKDFGREIGYRLARFG